MRQAAHQTPDLPGESPGAHDGNPWIVVASVFLWINLGALLSSLPVAAGLRQPVGELLN